MNNRVGISRKGLEPSLHATDVGPFSVERDHMNEIWKAIPGYDYYEASSLGRIRSVDRYLPAGDKKRFYKGKIIKPRPLPAGYLRISAGRGNDVYIHRLICFAFHGVPSDSKMVPNHKNGIKYDNRPENLEWVTRSENKKHAFHVLGIRPWNWTGRHHKTRAEYLLEIARKNINYLRIYETAKFNGVTMERVANRLGMKRSNFSMKLANARRWRKKIAEQAQSNRG